MTPEGKIKELVKKMLKEQGVVNASQVGRPVDDQQGWYYMPVQNGVGVSGIPDFIICYKGRFVAVETKAPGGKPTKFQTLQIASIQNGGGSAWIIDSPEGVEALRKRGSAWIIDSPEGVEALRKRMEGTP